MRVQTRAAAGVALSLLLGGAGLSQALDLGIETWAGNLGFASERTASDTSLPGSDYFWGLSVYGTQPVTDTIKVEAGFYSDPILRNTTRTIFTWDARFISVGIGPIFGLFNDWGTPVKSGLSASVRLEYPGVVFVTLRSDSSLGGSLAKAGDYSQALTEAVLGFYLPNAICSLELRTRSFQQKGSSEDVTDTLTEYTFATQLFKKNVPYRVRLWMGYDDLSRSYVSSSTTTATVGSVVLGTQVDVMLSGVLLTAGLEGNVYSFGLGSLVGGDSAFLFRSYAGVRLNLDSNPAVSRLL